MAGVIFLWLSALTLKGVMRNILLCSALLGMSSLAQAAGVIKVASMSPLSGPKSVLGVEVKRGVELAVRQQARSFQSLGYGLQLMTLNDQARPDLADDLLKQLLKDKAVLGVVGAQASGVTNALGEAIAKSRTPLAVISPTSTNDALTKHGWKFFSRMVAPDRAQSMAAAQYLGHSMKLNTAMVVSDNTTYGNGLGKAFARAFKGVGGSVISYQGVDTRNLKAYVKYVREVQPEIVYFGGTDVAAAPLIKALREAGVRSLFVGGDGLYSAEFVKRAGRAAEGVVFSSTFAPPLKMLNGKAFVKLYRSRYGTEPNGRAAFAYDATNVLLDAVRRQIVQRKRTPTREEVIAEVRKTDFRECLTVGVACRNMSGSVKFLSNGEREMAPVFMLTYDAKGNVVVKTTELIGGQEQ